MRRVLATTWIDIQIQFKQGFYYVSAIVAAILVIILTRFPAMDWSAYWPVIIMENLIINAFYFMAGLVLLEKAEGTLEAQIVSPLRPGEYLLSKVLSLLVLSLVETLVIVLIVSGARFNWPLLLLGIALLMAMYALYGFFVVARYDSITSFILPSALWAMGFSLPLLYYFDLWRTPLMFLHPLQGPLVLMQAAFESLPAWQLIYGVLYSALWVGVAFVITQRSFHRFVIRKEGVKS